MTEKILYCYNCKTITIYNQRDMNGNTGVESHCTSCGLFEWQNRSIEREKEKWVSFNQREVGEEKWKLATTTMRLI